MLDAGYPLSDVTAALCRTLAARGHAAADDRQPGGDPRGGAADPRRPSAAGRRGTPPLVALHFQEWWIRYQAALPALSITPIGAEESPPGDRACWTPSPAPTWC